MSIRLRITLLFVAALALLASMGSLLSYVVVRNDLRGRASDSARALARSAAAVHEVEGDARSLDRLAAPGDVIWLVDGTGKVINSTFGASGTTLTAVRAVVSDRQGHGWVSAEAPRPDGGLAIVVQDDHATRDTLGTLAWVLLLAGLGGLLVAAVAGAVLAARVLRPVDRMRREVDAIPGHELSRRVAEGRPDELGRLARAFNRLLVRAEDASRAQREFVADASHELKTPVTAVGGHARLAARAVATGDDERARESLEVVQRESMRMAATLRELLTLAEVGAAPSPTGTVDLTRVTTDAVEEVRATAPHRGVELVVPDTPATVVGDASRLRELLVVLLDNAVRYSPEDTPVQVRVTAADAGAAVEVRDHGSGMTDQDIAHAFDRFHRGSAAAQDIPGSGLGLAIAAAIADGHGARIELARHPGGGTLACVLFPRHENTEARAGGGRGGRGAPAPAV